MKLVKRFIFTILFFSLILAGLFFLAADISTRIPSLGIFGEAHKTMGTVERINHWTESGEAYTSPQVQFNTQSGQTVSVDMICPPLDCYAKYEVGSKVGVIYPSNFPELAIADTSMGRLGTPLFILVISLIFLGIGSVGFAVLIDDWREDLRRLFITKNHNQLTKRNSLG
jgi:Protein of unknown function (DUF3592)